ncbi:hypothetical protein Q5752_003838 [Cryptotrichosporon argae]
MSDIEEKTIGAETDVAVPELAQPGVTSAEGDGKTSGGPPRGGPPGAGPGGPRGDPSKGGPPGRGGGPPPPHFLAKIGMKALARNGGLLFLVLWASGMWIYGTLGGAAGRAHNLKVLVVDLDGGAVGAALTNATSATNAASVPSFVTATDMSADEAAQAVFNGKYWAAVVANEGVSTALNTSLTSDSSYNASAAYTFYGATVRYYTAFSGFVQPGVVEALAAASELVDAYAAETVAGSTLAASQASTLADTSGYTFFDVAPLPFQDRVFLNTFGIVISHLSQFFFNMMMSGIFNGVGIYRNTTIARLLKRSYPIKFGWTLLTSLSLCSFPLIYASGYALEAKTFFALWSAEWVYTVINFNTIHAILSFVPVPYISLCVFPWVVTSISSCIAPIEVSSGFYRISYIFPAHAYFNTVITAWGKGAVNRLHIYLPVLAAWLVVTELVWLFGIRTIAVRSTKPPPARR